MQVEMHQVDAKGEAKKSLLSRFSSKHPQLMQFIGSYFQMGKAMLNVNSFQLTLEQEFLINVAKQSAAGMTREQMFDLLLDTARLAMVRDNIIRDLMRDKLSQPEI